MTFMTGDASVIVIGGLAKGSSGTFYSIGVVRNGSNHITGFTGSAAVFSQGQFNDGGVVFGPSNVLFYTRFPTNEVGEVKNGSTTTDKVVSLTPLGVGSS